jgi:hypothetical protein
MSTYMERVHKAVDDADWQAFRKSMKGKSTDEKLRMLEQYYDTMVQKNGDCNISNEEFEAVKIRIDNYIKALCRGGQLEPGMTFDHFNDGCIRNHIRK